MCPSQASGGTDTEQAASHPTDPKARPLTCPATPYSQWGKFWAKLTEHFRMPWTGPDTSDEASYETITITHDPPRGYGPPGGVRFRLRLARWTKRLEVQKAWAEIAEKGGLREKGFQNMARVFGFTDLSIAMEFRFV